MDKTEAYSYLFTDALLAELILPPHRDLVFDAMHIFGGHNAITMIVIAVLASLSALVLNWLLGNILRNCQAAEELLIKSANYNIILSFLQKFWFIALICSLAIPLFIPIVMVILGLCRISLKKVIVLWIPIKIILLIISLYQP